LQEALKSFLQRRAAGDGFDQALERLSEEHLEAPSAALLACALHDPGAIEALVASALASVEQARRKALPSSAVSEARLSQLAMLSKSILDGWKQCHSLLSAASGCSEHDTSSKNHILPVTNNTILNTAIKEPNKHRPQ
jgi:hypothetical protein